MERYAWISANTDPETMIVLPDNLEFATMFYYAPPALASRLVYVIFDNEFNGVGFQKLKSCCNAPGQAFASEAFLSTHQSFFVYGRSVSLPLLDQFQAGRTITLKGVSDNHYLVLA